MNQPRRALYPPAAPAWMLGEQRRRVLDLGSGDGAFAAMLLGSGHEVFCVDKDVAAVQRLPEQLGTRLHVAGRVESLPYLSCHFDVVTSSQNLHEFAPGLALSEIARVLVPGGHLAIAYNTRDDTVPWVRRLAAVVRQVDPNAMIGAYGVEAVQQIDDSPYFSATVRKNFRNWVPITRPSLVAMVERLPAVQDLATDRRAELLGEVGAVYDGSARPPEPLLLPYQASCWRAEVDHSGLVLADDDTEAIRISF